MTDPRERAAHRAALDHVLTLIVGQPWSDMLVLRGSRLLRAWAGDLAREPADLDFVVLPDLSVPIDPLDPQPYVPALRTVQQWPEFADGAGRYEIWTDGDEEFRTNGARAVVPPEGLRWNLEPDRPPFGSDLRSDLTEQVRQHSHAPSGVVLDPDNIDFNSTWAYSGYSFGGDGPGGIRLIIPWSSPGVGSGQVQVDFALDERLPQPPAWTRIPLATDATRQLVVQAATRELSLAWKLLWLHTDSVTADGARPKDLYDAVILAEDVRTRLSPTLLRRVLSQASATGAPASGADLEISPPADADWSAFAAGIPGAEGSARDWLNRLISALAPMTATRPATDAPPTSGEGCGSSDPER